METQIKIILAMMLVNFLGSIGYAVWFHFINTPKVPTCYAPNGAPGSCKKTPEVCNDCMHEFCDTCMEEENPLPITTWGCNGQGPVITIRKHELAHMPGENPEAYRFMVRDEDGTLMLCGVERSFLEASQTVERYLKAWEKEKLQ